MGQAAEAVAENLLHSTIDAHLKNIEQLINILDEFLSRRAYTSEGHKGVITMLRHLRRGGNVNVKYRHKGRGETYGLS